MARVTEYYVVRQENLDHFIDQVNDMLNDGWVGAGGACVIVVGDRVFHYQTMVRERVA